jgi:hypothetical protein
MFAFPLVLRVIHASSKAVSSTTRVSGSKDPLPVPSIFPLQWRSVGITSESLSGKVVEFLKLTAGSFEIPRASLAMSS